MPLLTKPLGRQERQAVALRRQGLTTSEIADAMLLTTNHVSTVLTHAKRKGAVVPRVPRKPAPVRVPIERLVQIRAELLRAGYSRYGLYAVIAERVGMTTNAVRVRLWKHDHKPQGEQAA